MAVTFHGGNLLTAAQVQAVYWGSNWSAPNVQKLEKFLSMIVNSEFMDMLQNAGYGVGRGTFSPGFQYLFNQPYGTCVNDTLIQSTFAAMAGNGSVQPNNPNRLYVVFMGKGLWVQAGTASTKTGTLGYHASTQGLNGKTIQYIVIAYPSAPNSMYPTMDVIDGITQCCSHEIAEACTDPGDQKPGWYNDATGLEIADPCNGTTYLLNGFVVTCVVNQQSQVISPATTKPPPVPPVLSLNAVPFSANRTFFWWTYPAVGDIQSVKLCNASGTISHAVGVGVNSVVLSDVAAADTYYLQSVNGASTANGPTISVLQPASPDGTLF